MLNFIKSEFYRISRDRGFYTLAAVLAAVVLILNALLAYKGLAIYSPYRTTSFSFSNLVANPMVFCLIGMFLQSVLYEDNRKNGNLKNTVAFGLSRTKIFAGQCITALVTATILMTVILVIYIGSAFLLLEHGGPVTLQHLLTEVPAVFLIAAASLICSLVLVAAMPNTTVAAFSWAIIWYLLPTVCYYLGLRFELMKKIAMWMPQNFFHSRVMTVNLSVSQPLWGTPEGMIKCILVGVIGTAVFSALGVVLLRKKEL